MPGIQRIENAETWLPASKIAFVQRHVQALTTGQSLYIQADGLADSSGNLIVKFSKKFLEQIAVYRASGYELTEARVNFLVYWTDQERGRS